MEQPIRLLEASVAARLIGYSEPYPERSAMDSTYCEVCESLDEHGDPITGQPIYRVDLDKILGPIDGSGDRYRTFTGFLCWDCLTSWFELEE